MVVSGSEFGRCPSFRQLQRDTPGACSQAGGAASSCRRDTGVGDTGGAVTLSWVGRRRPCSERLWGVHDVSGRHGRKPKSPRNMSKKNSQLSPPAKKARSPKKNSLGEESSLAEVCGDRKLPRRSPQRRRLPWRSRHGGKLASPKGAATASIGTVRRAKPGKGKPGKAKSPSRVRGRRPIRYEDMPETRLDMAWDQAEREGMGWVDPRLTGSTLDKNPNI